MQKKSHGNTAVKPRDDSISNGAFAGLLWRDPSNVTFESSTMRTDGDYTSGTNLKGIVS